MRVQKFAERLGVSVDTIKRLEQRGMIQSKRDWAGHRRYSDEDVERAKGVLFAESKAEVETR